jgi:hypothetical protein
MYFHQNTISEALRVLSNSADTFFGVTFLTCKLHNLVIGDVQEFAIDKAETELLKNYYQPDATSDRFFRVFRISDKQNFWLRPDFPSKGSQRTRTGKFKDAFIHPKNTQLWGWSSNYLLVLKENLYRGRRIPVLPLAIWLFRNEDWGVDTSADQIIKHFYKVFNILPEEMSELFDESGHLFDPASVELQTRPADWEDIRVAVGAPSPPDATEDVSGILSFINLKNVGPARQLRINFADRLNVIVGDNGLGKTFLLECAWWALSGRWTSEPVIPLTHREKRDPRIEQPTISFGIFGDMQRRETLESFYDWNIQDWRFPKKRLTLPGLVLYARIDGAFAVWDSARRYSGQPQLNGANQPVVFDRNAVWNGIIEDLGGKTRYIANGLISDWIVWQSDPNQTKFDTLTKVLRRLSPTTDVSEGDLGMLEPGSPTRVPSDSRLIPTIRHPYGEVPLTHASASVRRIVALAYLIVWAWEEHKANAASTQTGAQTQLVLLIDEIEDHLHPRWQRVILPALLGVSEDLASAEADINVQFVVATHSPLVLASIEPHFEIDLDRIFHLNLQARNLFDGEVTIEEVPFQIRGTADSWLTAENVFELQHPRSPEGEKAILDAVELQLKANVHSEAVREVHERLVRYIGAHDIFWPRWTFFAKRHGIE